MFLSQVVSQFFRYEDRPMHAAGASDGNDKLVLALPDIIRNQKPDHIFQFIQKDICLRCFQHKLLNLRIISGFRPQRFQIIRIG